MPSATIGIGDVFTSKDYGEVVVLQYDNCKKIKVKFLATGFETNVESTRLRRGLIVDYIARDTKCYGKGIYDFWKFDKDIIRTKGFQKIYNVWRHMLRRCYCEDSLKKRSTYRGCTVAEEWFVFSNFYSWVVVRNWEGNHLDKDILVKGNKVYSKDTCVFVHPRVNTFFCFKRDSKHSTGVYYREASGRYLASVNNPFSGKVEFLGSYGTEQNAHEAWRIRKQELAILLAKSEYVWDSSVKEAILNLFK